MNYVQDYTYKYRTTYATIKDGVLIVTHAGNMGSTKKNVEKNLEKMLNMNPYNTFKILVEEGSPDYLYNVVFSLNS